jgi:hypothetical protein
MIFILDEMKMSELINWSRIDYKVRRVNKNLGDVKTASSSL